MVLVERGSDVEGELVYFSEKENNVANVATAESALCLSLASKWLFEITFLGEIFPS